jgi:hypothetical protein
VCITPSETSSRSIATQASLLRISEDAVIDMVQSQTTRNDAGKINWTIEIDEHAENSAFACYRKDAGVWEVRVFQGSKMQPVQTSATAREAISIALEMLSKITA